MTDRHSQPVDTMRKSKNLIDLRSDTVTLPTPQMHRAMAKAPLGDDVFGDDPTVNTLEKLAAERMGKEDALFVPSGTMGNLTALLTHCLRGDEIIMGERSHTFLSEGGGAAVLGGISIVTVPNQADGSMRLDDIQSAVRALDVHHPRSKLVCIENTHSRCGGVVLSPEYTDQVSELAHGLGLAVHLDGARIFNAAVALHIDVRDLTRPVDSVQFCLSKGLSAPIGSLLCAPGPFIAQARRWRKVLGGGMRQAGVLAAAGIEALNTMVSRLAEDHDNASCLAHGFSEIPGFLISPASVQTNIVIWDLTLQHLTAERVVQHLDSAGLRVMSVGSGQLRAVTHYGITAGDINRAIEVASQVMSSLIQEE